MLKWRKCSMKSRLPEGLSRPQSMNGIIKEAQKMQERMEEIKQEVCQIEFASTAGGGAVEAIANGSKQLVKIKIKPEVVDLADLEMLQDLIVVAVNNSLQKASEHYDNQINQITGGLNIPGLG